MSVVCGDLVYDLGWAAKARSETSAHPPRSTRMPAMSLIGLNLISSVCSGGDVFRPVGGVCW